MAEKKDSFSLKSIVAGIGSAILGEGVKAVAEELHQKVHQTIVETQQRVEHTIHHTLKVLTLYLIIFIGFVFALVGFAVYLNETVPAFENGMGYVVIGMGLIVMGIFANWTSK